MFLARWIIEVRFGKKGAFMEALKKWQQEVGDKVGLSREKASVAVGSIGTCESRFEFNYKVESLDELQKMWDEMAGIDAHIQFGKDLEPLIVSGSNRWEVLRFVEYK